MAKQLDEFYDEVLSVSRKHSKRKTLPIKTYFIDSSDSVAPFMNSKTHSLGFTFHQNLHFLGRAGVKEFSELSGLKVAYLSGKDSEVFGEQVFAELEGYSGNYFV